MNDDVTVAGVDLAASPANTGIAVLRGNLVTVLETGATGERIVELSTHGAGWPTG